MTLFRRAVLALTLACALAFATPLRAQDNILQEANQLFRQGQLDRAMDRLDAFLANNPKDARGRFMKGLILTEQNKPADAIKVFTSLTEDYPELPEPYNNLAVLYASQGHYEKARAALEMAIRTHPSYATAHENLGDIYAKMASQAYDKALQLDRANAAAQTKLNLIRDIFSGGSRPPRAAAAKSEPSRKVASAPISKAPSPPSPATEAKTEPAPVATVGAPLSPPPVQAAPAVPAPNAAPAPKATKDAVSKPEAQPTPAQRDEDVMKAVSDWAKAWSDNDVPGYLAHYAENFETPTGMSRAEWEAQRKARIAKPRNISVEIEALKVRFTGEGRAIVTFRQRYQSDTFKANVNKSLTMVRSGAKWLIQQEDVGG